MTTAVKDRWHQLADAIADSNLPASDKAIFRYLLDRADYGTADLAAQWTPTEMTTGRKTSHSRRQVQYSVAHLRRHGWLVTKRSSRKLEYELTFGTWCDCTGRRHVADQSATSTFSATSSATEGKAQPPRSETGRAANAVKVANVADLAGTTYSHNGESSGLTAMIGATGAGDRRNQCAGIGATDRRNAAGQAPVVTERQREGKVERGIERKTATCSTPRCDAPARLYPAGWRCDEHRPQPVRRYRVTTLTV